MACTRAAVFPLLFFISVFSVSAGEACDSVRIYFHQGKTSIDHELFGNGSALDRISRHVLSTRRDIFFVIRKVKVVGGASPEGCIALNRWLSEARADSLFNYVNRYCPFSGVPMVSEFLGRDWNGLLSLAEATKSLPCREETLALLREIASETRTEAFDECDIYKLERLCGGVPYRYMYRHLFPRLRSSKIYVWYESLPQSVIVPSFAPLQIPETSCPTALLPIPSSPALPEKSHVPFYMGIKSNLLYDALLVPNIGLEFYLGKSWSLAGNWMYSWWKSDRRHNYWRIYGGDLEIRRWFGKKAKRKPLTGHHMGLYGQIVTYDFELGGRGYLGDRWSYGVGIDYGYSLPVSRRFSIDFTLGVGYLGGKYKEYMPIDDHYVWQVTKRRRWFGPTKAEVVLVWLVGGNVNRKEGLR